MISGAHVVIYSRNADVDRAFFRDVLRFQSVDAGHGWLIFGMSPAEAAIHPVEQEKDGESWQENADESSKENAGPGLLSGALYLMCDDLEAFIATMKAKNVNCSEVETARWGRIITIPLPSGGRIGMYQPRHPTALHLSVA